MYYFLAILCYIGLITFVVGIIWLIFNLIKKRNFRTPVLVMLFGLALFLGAPAIEAFRTNAKEEAAEAQSRKESSELDSLLSDDTDSSSEDSETSTDDSLNEDYSSDSESDSESDTESSSSESDSSSSTSEESSDDTDFSDISDLPKSERLEAAVNIIKKNFSETASVEYDSSQKFIKITPKDPEVTLGALQAKDSNDTEDWDDMTRAIDTMSSTMKDELDLSVPIAIMNPSSTDDRVLYMTKNGKTMYDITDEN